MIALLALGVVLVGCGSGDKTSEGTTGATTGGETKPASSGELKIDGSSTVMPISQAVAEAVSGSGDFKIAVSESGTGGGMKKFVAGEIQIADASRPIKKEEEETATKNKIEFIELPIAFDGLSVVVNKNNSFVDKLTIEELHKIWAKDSTVNNWKDVRPGFPDKALKLFGPGNASGTFEYFTKAVNGKEKESRTDYQPSEDDNVLVKGVEGEEGGLAYFGFAYYVENKDKLKVVPVDAGKGAMTPTEATIQDGTYAPLSRPLFIYVNKAAADDPAVKAFVEFMLSDKGKAAIKEAGYVTLPDEAYTIALKRFQDKKTGSIFAGAQPGMTIKDVLAQEQK